MWKPDNINLGRVKVGTHRTLKYKFEGDIEIEKVGRGLAIYPSCGCSTPIWDQENKTLTLNFKAQPVPDHLRADGKTSYPADKNVTIHRTVDGYRQVDLLTFKAHVYES